MHFLAPMRLSIQSHNLYQSQPLTLQQQPQKLHHPRQSLSMGPFFYHHLLLLQFLAQPKKRCSKNRRINDWQRRSETIGIPSGRNWMIYLNSFDVGNDQNLGPNFSGTLIFVDSLIYCCRYVSIFVFAA